MTDLNTQPHVRFNLLRGEWVLVSLHRHTRPWQGQVETTPDPEMPPHDPQLSVSPPRDRLSGVR